MTIATLRAALCVSLMALLLAAVSMAQQPVGNDPIADILFAPDLVLANQKVIELDDAQKSFVRGEVLKAQPRFGELQFQMQDGMESLTGMLKQNPADEAQVLAQLDKILATEREVKRTQIALMVRIKNKLTLEQQARLRQIRSSTSAQ
jgi:hypothetical protein